MGVEDIGVDLADGPDDVATERQGGGTTRVHTRGHRALVQSGAPSHGSSQLAPYRNCLRCLLAGEHNSESFVLGGQHIVAGRVHMTQFEQGGTQGAVGLVECDGLQQTGSQRSAQHVVADHQGVHQTHRDPGEAGTVEVAVAEEGVWHRLADTQAEQDLAHTATTLLHCGEPTGERRPRNGLT